MNPHFHSLCLDGVYVEHEHGELTFHSLPCLTNSDVAEILQITTACILRLLRQKGVVEDDAVNADETLTDTEPALAELAVASTLGRVRHGQLAAAHRALHDAQQSTSTRESPWRTPDTVSTIPSAPITTPATLHGSTHE